MPIYIYYHITYYFYRLCIRGKWMRRLSSVWKRNLALKKIVIYIRSVKYMPICKLFVLLSKIFYSLFFCD